MTAAPLEGVRVLDLSRVLAGPWATQLLADLGAEVIKVERPGSGDDTRAWGPPFAEGADGAPGQSAYFRAANRGKRSVTVDLGSDEGREIVRALADNSDVLIENFKAGGLEKMGLGFEALSARNPGLIYCSITGFGQTGPHRDRAGYDLLVQAMGGLMSVTGDPDGPPMKVGVALADILTGLYAGNAILAALHARGASGRGMHIDLALLDVQIATLANQAQNYLVSGRVPQRRGNLHPNIVPYQDFATADGYMVLAVGNDAQFARFCELIGAPDLASDLRFSRNAARVEHRDILVPQIAGTLAQRTTADWLKRLDSAGIPAAEINTLDKVFSDPQIEARGILTQAQDDAAQSPLVANPIHMNGASVTSTIAPPELGQDSETVLMDLLKKTPEEIATLRRKGVI